VEVTSQKTRRKDLGLKKSLYERIGTEEYILFDPFGEYLKPRLQGFTLFHDCYQPIPLEPDGSLLSRTTGLWMKPEGKRLRLAEAVEEVILWPEELEAARAREAAARRAAEDERRAEAVARRAAETAQRLAEARAQAAELEAAEEKAARRATEERLRALEEELSRLRKT